MRLDDLLQKLTHDLLAHYLTKLLAGASKPNPKLLGQVQPRIQAARDLLLAHGASCVEAVVGEESSGEFRVKSSSGEKT